MRLNVWIALTVLAGLLVASPARAQEEGPVSRLVPDLLLTAAQLAHGNTPTDQSTIFYAGLQQSAIPGEINRALAVQLATFPLGPTATAAVMPVAQARSESRSWFGSGYGDRALTIGRKNLGFSVAYQTTDFNTLDGLDIRANDLNFYITQGTTNLSDPLKRDLLQQTLSIKLNRKAVSFIFDYGVTDRLDVGVVLPIVQMAIDARVLSQIHRTATAATPDVHYFETPIACTVAECLGNNLASKAFYASATSRGVGDILFRVKYDVLSTATSAVAATIDARVPSGNADEFIGLGTAEVIPAIVWSMRGGRVAPRARVAYAFSSGNLSPQLDVTGSTAPVATSIPKEVQYSLGADVGLFGPVALVFDVTGRRVPNLRSFSTGTQVFPSRGPGNLPSADFVAPDVLVLGANRAANLVLGSAGLRVDLGRSVVANASVLFPTTSAGLRPSTKGVFWLDYGF
jgi:hypothetical protein